MTKAEKITAQEFKAKCLKLLDEVRDQNKEIVITKRGKPVAKLVPVADKKRSSSFGGMNGTVEIKVDITAPIDVQWDTTRDD